MDKDTKRTVEIILKGDQAATTIRGMTGDVAQLSKEIRGLTPGTEDFIKVSKKLTEIKGTLGKAREEAGLMGKAMKDLKDEVSAGQTVWQHYRDIARGVFTGEGLLQAIEKVKDMVVDFYNQSVEKARALNNANVIQSTQLKGLGDAAAMNKKELAELTEEIEKNTNFTKLQSIEAENILLTYDKISHDIFPETLKAAANISTLFGGDLSRSTEALGRALENPIKGVTALRRAHVALSAEALASITAMAKSGNTLGAQKAILAEVEKRYGGLAQAVAETDASMGKRLDKSVEKLQEGFGALIIHGIAPAQKAMADLISSVSDYLFPAKKQSEEMEEQRSKLNELVIAVTSATDKEGERKKAINALNDAFPDFLDNLNKEKVSNEELRDRLKEVNEQMINQIVIQQKQEEIKAKADDAAKATAKYAGEFLNLNKALAELSKNNKNVMDVVTGDGTNVEKAQKVIELLGGVGAAVSRLNYASQSGNFQNVKPYDAQIVNLQRYVNLLGDADNKQKAVKKEVEDMQKDMQSTAKILGVDISPEKGSKQANVNFTPGPSKAEIERQRKEDEAIREQKIKDTEFLNSLILDMQQKHLQSKEDKEIEAEQRSYQKHKDDIAKSEAELSLKFKAFETNETDHQKNITAIREKFQKQRDEDEYKQQQEFTDDWYAQEKTALEQQLLSKTITQEQYDAKVEALDTQLIKERIRNAQDYNVKHFELTQQLLQQEISAQQHADAQKKAALKKQLDNYKEYADQAENILDKLNQYVTQQENAKLEADKAAGDQQVQMLQNQLNNKLISQGSYNAQVKAINDQYAKEERQAKHDQAIRDRDMAIFKTIISIAAGEVEAIAASDYVKAAALAITGAAELAVIASEPIPALDGGGFTNVTTGNGRSYTAANPSALSGMVNRPSLALVAENKPEYVINNKMLQNPWVVNTVGILENMRVNKTYDAGGYTSTSTRPSAQASAPATSSSTNSDAILQQLISHVSNSNKATRDLHQTLKRGLTATLGIESAAESQRRMNRSISDPGLPTVK